MKTRLIIFAIVIATSSVFAKPTDTHKRLGTAACVAIRQSNTNLFKALLDAGLHINEPISFILETSQGTLAETEVGTPLYHAVSHYCSVFPRKAGALDFVQFLLDNGADRDKRNQWGERPVDFAYKRNQAIFCELLTKPEGDKELIAGFPIEAWEELFLGGMRRLAQRPIVGIILNESNAPPEFIEKLRQRHPELNLPKQAEDPMSIIHAQDRITKESEVVVKATIKETDDGYEWRFVIRLSWGTSWGSDGTLVNKYGYWISIEKSKWNAS